jgi:diguanylate cyclase (GGDEF)-like protein
VQGLGHDRPGQAISDFLGRIAGALSVMLYEMEYFPDGSFRCLEYRGLQNLLGPVPAGISPEEAYDSAVHPDDRDHYDAASTPLNAGQAVELEYRLLGYDGRERWVFDRMQPRRTEDGRLLVDGVVADVTGRKEGEMALLAAQELETRRLAHAALHDSMTGLPNRFAFDEHLRMSMARAERNGLGVAVLFVDVDNLKLVNDSFGHDAGDQVLRTVADRLRRAARSSDVVARQGGDEFLVLLTDLPPVAGTELRLADVAGPAEQAARRVRRVLRQAMLVDGVEIFMTASVGISLYPYDAANGHTLTKHADAAMYAAKVAGRDRYRRYVLSTAAPLANFSLATRLRRAIEQGHGLVLHYQPIVRLDNREVVGAEALIRWQDDDRGLLQPAEFLPLAERVGLSGLISDWVIDTACRQAAEWQAAGLDVYTSVNLPPAYCDLAGIRRLTKTMGAFEIGPGRLVIEVTEAALSWDAWRMVDPALAELRRLGLRLAIDDFGTGHSSLDRLNRSWASILKIDRTFVRDIDTSRNSGPLLSSIVHLAKSLGLEPVAEGIETEAQRRFLVDIGCEFGQGFLFSEAVPADRIEAFHPARLLQPAESASRGRSPARHGLADTAAANVGAT